MSIQGIEDLMFQLSDLFLAPVLLLLIFLFAYSLFSLGSFICEIWQRYYFKNTYSQIVLAIASADKKTVGQTLRGYPLTEKFLAAGTAGGTTSGSSLNRDQLDIAALGELETLRSVSRLAPMLGLIATMVPMGPALKSLADGNVQGISENLIVAFSAVIFGLVIASITFWIATIKKRWLATELVNLQPYLDSATTATDTDHTPEIEREAA